MKPQNDQPDKDNSLFREMLLGALAFIRVSAAIVATTAAAVGTSVLIGTIFMGGGGAAMAIAGITAGVFAAAAIIGATAYHYEGELSKQSTTPSEGSQSPSISVHSGSPLSSASMPHTSPSMNHTSGSAPTANTISGPAVGANQGAQQASPPSPHPTRPEGIRPPGNTDTAPKKNT